MSILSRGGKENLQVEVNASPASSGGPDNDGPGSQVRIGKTIVIRGEVSGEEDLNIEGRVEGKITLENHHLVVGEGGNVSAEVLAKSVTIIGRLEGNTHATERVLIREGGSLTGDIRSPRIVIEDGAKFKGSVDMDVEAPAQPFRAKIGKTDPKWVESEIAEQQPAAGDLK